MVGGCVGRPYFTFFSGPLGAALAEAEAGAADAGAEELAGAAEADAELAGAADEQAGAQPCALPSRLVVRRFDHWLAVNGPSSLGHHLGQLTVRIRLRRFNRGQRPNCDVTKPTPVQVRPQELQRPFRRLVANDAKF